MTAFGDAFKAARSAGKTVFTWNGKKYHTKTKEEMEGVRAKAGADKKAPTPTARQPIDSLASSGRTTSHQSASASTRGTMFDQAVAATTGSRPSSSQVSTTQSKSTRSDDDKRPSGKQPRVEKRGDQWVVVGGPTIGERIGGSIYSARKTLGDAMRYKGKRK